MSKNKKQVKNQLHDALEENKRLKAKNEFLLREIKLLITDLDNTDLALSPTPSFLKKQAH